ncbi:dipeptidyl peptidase 4 [Alosa sapidissima]|uniref:dipeptidyl peptidase 4 n=1 Tax=Alosa sapidissima TaxID=34773 RepID=UPI001C0983A4|nr:dipeptidyl peptidase 4 [Alosa sapidissima]
MGCSKALVGFVGVVALIMLISIPTAIHLNRQGKAKRTFTFADYFNDTIRYKKYGVYWVSDNEYLHKSKEGNIYIHNVETKEVSPFLSNTTFSQVDSTDYIVSADRKYICFESNYSKHWRHSFSASFSLFNLENSSFITSDIPQAVQLLTMAPSGSMLAYTWRYNIYLKQSATAPSIQVTTNGEENQILNGIPDWVYEEEVFASNEAMWWSTTGKFLAYLELNDTNVHTIDYSWFGNGQYPETVAVPYPKAGSTIPKVKLYVIDTANPTKRSQVVVPSPFGSSDHYLSSVTWVTDERVAVQWLKRKQNHVLLQIYDFDGTNWVESTKFEQMSKTGWVGQFNPSPAFFAEDNMSFYKVMSDSKGYKHIHYVKGGIPKPITSGKWEVIYISKLAKDAVYYISNEHMGRPGQRNLYKISIGSGGVHSAPRCLSCSLHPERCQYNLGHIFSRNSSYVRMDCYGPGVPLFALLDNEGSEMEVLEDNSKLQSILEEFHLPTVKRGTLRLAGFDLWYQMMLPPNFDASKKYPLLIYVYGGPCSQTADYSFRLGWSTYLASAEGIIVASFDGRGSGYQGDEIMHSIYQRLGTYEVEDQIWAVRQFIDMGFIDKKRIAIWGWSYGGYVTSMALGSGSGLFKCGMAVAPVAKWEYYDAVYTERYMSRPEENVDGYKNSTVTSRAKNFGSVEYLLIHGTADDNVHFQQSAQISKALVDQKIDFDTMWYTDKDHGLGGSATYHVYNHMSHFLQKCFAQTK